MSLLDKFKKSKSEKGEKAEIVNVAKNTKKTTLKAQIEDKVADKTSVSTESRILDIKSSHVDKGFAYRILERALVSEKSAIGEAKGTYAFIVKPKSTKLEIKKAIEIVYGVKPVSVRVINVMGKKTRFGKYSGQRKNFKKAIVTLAKGSTISVHEGV